jgi:hypothetical protein
MANYPKSKGRRSTAPFLALPKSVINTHKFWELGGSSIKLLVQIGEQYNGINNGDLQASFSVLQEKGWRSKETLNNALKELIEKKFIYKTRQGGFPNKCSLFAITWRTLDYSEKYDAGAISQFKIGIWKD